MDIDVKWIFICFPEWICALWVVICSLLVLLRDISSGSDGRVPKKEDNIAAEVGLTQQTKTMSSKHFFQKWN